MERKWLLAGLTLVSLALVPPGWQVSLAQGHASPLTEVQPVPRIVVNGQPLRLRDDQLPFLVGGRAFIPMRAIFETLGATVHWQEEERTARAVRGSVALRLPVGSFQAEVNGRQVLLDQPAQIRAGRTYVPLRFAGEELGAQVHWDEGSRTVTVSLADAASPAWVSRLNGNLAAAAPDRAYLLQLQPADRLVRLVGAMEWVVSDVVRSDPELVRAINRDGWRLVVTPVPGPDWEIPLSSTRPGATEALETPAPIMDGMFRVEPPEGGGSGFTTGSAWEAASVFGTWVYGVEVEAGPWAAPGLVDGLTRPATAETPPRRGAGGVRVGQSLIGTWQEGDRTYFRLAITTTDLVSGLMSRGGMDLIEVTRVEGAGQTVTGYGHAPWPSDQTTSPVKVWFRYAEAWLPGPVLESPDHGWLLPLRALEQVGRLTALGSGAYAVDLYGLDQLSGPLAPIAVDGVEHVRIPDLVTALDGRQAGDFRRPITYKVDWRPEILQLHLMMEQGHSSS